MVFSPTIWSSLLSRMQLVDLLSVAGWDRFDPSSDANSIRLVAQRSTCFPNAPVWA